VLAFHVVLTIVIASLQQFLQYYGILKNHRYQQNKTQHQS